MKDNKPKISGIVKEELLAKRRRELCKRFCASAPKLNLFYSDNITTCDEKEELQDFLLNCNNLAFAATGISLIDAIWGIADSDFQNGTQDLSNDVMDAVHESKN